MPAEPLHYVFDACAVIALLDDEPGANVVEEILTAENHRCLIHLLNVCEVYYHLYRRAGKERAAQLQGVLETYGFELDSTLVPSLWEEASRLKAEWRKVSLADCFALALTLREKATLVTSDRHELEPIAQASVCPLRFIR